MAESASRTPAATAIDQAWLDRHHEEALEPGLPIVDAHHHLWDRPDIRYMLPQFVAEFGGHNVRASVYIESRSMYRADGTEALRSVGEVEFANGVAAMSASGAYGPARICAGIVGHADFDAPETVPMQLEALVAAGNGRLKGVRGHAPWDPLGVTLGKTWSAKGTRVDMRYGAPEGWLRAPEFRASFAQLAPRKLSYDSWAFQHQLGDIADLAGQFEDTSIIVNHVGGPVLIGPYENTREEAFARWRAGIEKLKPHPNVSIKLGGLGIGTPGLRLRDSANPPTSERLAERLRPFVETCIAAVGVERCMFESDFPPDKVSYSYVVLWNAFKRVTEGYSAAERSALFSATAARVYRLEIDTAS